MRAQVHEIFSLDIDDLVTWRPPDPECFSLSLRFVAGPENGEGGESFDLVVCTPGWLEANIEPDSVFDCRHHLVVRRFDLDRLVAFIRGYVNSCTGETWSEVGEKVGRLGMWEFEDYRSPKGDSPADGPFGRP